MRAWRWLPAGMTAVVAAMLYSSLSVSSEDPLREFAAEHERERLAHERREVAWGHMHDGSMVDHYQRCMELLPSSDEYQSLDALSDDELRLDVRAVALRSVWQQALRHLSRGAHARDTSYAWRSLSTCPGIPEAWFVGLETRLLLWEGRELDAVRLALDLMTMQVDTALFLGQDPFGVSLAANQARDWASGSANVLGPQARAVFDRGLELLQRRIARCDPLRTDVAGWSRAVVADEYWRPFTIRERLRAWSHGFRPEAELREYLEAVLRVRSLWSAEVASISERADLLFAARAQCPRYKEDFFLDALRSEGHVRAAVEAVRQLRCLLR